MNNPYNGYGYGYDGQYDPSGNMNYGQQPMYNSRNGAYGMSFGWATTKKDVLAFLQSYCCPNEMVQVECFDTLRTRHICPNVKEIVLLGKQVVQVPTNNGMLGVEVFFCPRCRKLVINSQSLDFY